MAPNNDSNHDSQSFSSLGARAIEWVERYLSTVSEHPVAPPTSPGDVLAKLPEHAPEHPEPWDDIFSDLDDIILPHTLHWQHPAFFGYFPCNTSEPAILADIISAGLGTQGMLWQTAPAINELERRLLDQMATAIDLPESFRSTSPAGGGVIQSTASEATLAALCAARTRALSSHPDADPRSLTYYTSDQAHSSVIKAAMIAGVACHAEDRSQLRIIPSGENYALDADALALAVKIDTDEGRIPALVSATLGTTATGAFDPIDMIHEAISTAASPGQPWIHVDAAWAGAALVCPEHRAMLKGIEHADSFCFNPHKWLLTTFDCDLFWTRDRASLIDSLSITPAYLRSDASDTGDVFDYRDWGVPLGRRARALKLWFVLRAFGLEQMRTFIRSHITLAESFETWAVGDPRFSLTVPRSLALVCLHATRGQEPDNGLTLAIAKRINERGRAYVTPTTLETPVGPLATIRVAIGAINTQQQHLDILREELTAAHDALA